MQYVKIKFLMEEVPTLKYDILSTSIITLEDTKLFLIFNLNSVKLQRKYVVQKTIKKL
jgi:hypothetical protein